ncbi:butyryl-CoA:acetoacetate CoA-transferase beta subunit [Pelagirhabdus alkalitolerans]|uniref:Butyryl-CoA:acetoacetate CoA-transferase beta subunit n=1 Tax=Pelagirhabdus alkalitolerans TaxID=1612202 RepID=A0A1G6M3I0_9BACI|nr:3-oxoacid CoA-transferase subunit B [Pelagirhabdus alkalitolerans]SDC49516.1 butyryl-CoA:acetoacetate CoA-transferase beta subunit [Pelagirhabdus alkalitolerans]
MNKEEMQTLIAKRVAYELEDQSLVNLGIGLPTKAANYIPDDVEVMFQSENGFVGLRGLKEDEEDDGTIVNAGGQPVGIEQGGAFFDSSTSFGIIRGGYVDCTILGALQVDLHGNIANYMIPGKMVPGMGGAMDLLEGAKKVIVAMQHTAKGSPKILNECNLPLTASEAVDLIVTEMGVIEVTNQGLTLIEYNPAFTIDEIKEATEAPLTIADDVKDMTLNI